MLALVQEIKFCVSVHIFLFTENKVRSIGTCVV